MSIPLSTALPTSKALKDFMTQFQGAEELDVIDNVGQVEGNIMLTGYNRLSNQQLFMVKSPRMSKS